MKADGDLTGTEMKFSSLSRHVSETLHDYIVRESPRGSLGGKLRRGSPQGDPARGFPEGLPWGDPPRSHQITPRLSPPPKC